MDAFSIAQLTLLIFLAAGLYSAVGHAGASGYLAAMALYGLAPTEMKPTALMLNILVASIASYKYIRADCFSGRLLWPLVITSIPLAYVGGQIQLEGLYYKPLVGCVLLYAAWYFLYRARRKEVESTTAPARGVLLVMGSLLGFLSGLVGVGGGIFLSPLLLYFRWAQIKIISGVAATFILVNSIAGLSGFLVSRSYELPDGIVWWGIAAIAGGLIGAEYGSRRLANPTIKVLLAVALIIAGLKMIWTGWMM